MSNSDILLFICFSWICFEWMPK